MFYTELNKRPESVQRLDPAPARVASSPFGYDVLDENSEQLQWKIPLANICNPYINPRLRL